MKYIIATVTFLLATTASACSFTSEADIFKTPQENYPNYTYVMSGTITKVTSKGESQGNTYEFAVQGVHKGSVDSEVLMIDSPGHSCGFFSTKGTHLLLFTNDLKNIDESNPRQQFETVGEAYQMGYSLETQPGPTNTPVACTREYRPVCAAYQVQCITTPCPPIDQTYSNECMARADGATIQYEGVCAGDTNTGAQPASQKPTTPSGEDFVGPTGPPPYDNSPDAVTEDTPTLSWWARLWAWVVGVATWK